MKKFLIILLLIIGFPSTIFITDNYLKSDYKNPFKVGKAFSFAYMIKDTSHMKSWADKEIYKNIDELQYSTPVSYGSEAHYFWEWFDLVSSRKIGSTLVCIYSFNDNEHQPLFYSVVLKPVAPPSLLERFKGFIYWDVPFGKKILKMPVYKERWLAVDFFTNDDFGLYLQAFERELEDINEFTNKSLERLEHIGIKIDQIKDFENKWANEEKIQQNEEIKKLYMDYLKLFNYGNE